MLKLLFLSVAQSFLMASTQVLLKVAFTRMGKFAFTKEYFKELLVNWPFALSGIAVTGASILWFYILKHFPLSQAYPLVSISYVFGMIASIYVFGEQIPITRWFGVLFIMVGVFVMLKQ